MAGFRRISGAEVYPQHLRGAVVAIGNFDGVHRGHQYVLERALELAKASQKPAVVLTFEPNPRSVFQPDLPLFRLTPAPMKAKLLGLMGFDGVLEQHFTREFASFSPDLFEHDILVEQMGVSQIVVGYDFRYGKGRGGTPETLAKAGKKAGFGVSIVDAFSDEDGAVISSSRIRSLLAQADLGEAAGLLGYRFTVEAEITGGKRLGRTLGFPTANMVLPGDVELAYGVYAVRFRRPDGSLFDGVANFGRRPTVSRDGEPLLETYVFDFAGDLYGEVCSVSFFGYLRGEVKFDGLDALVVQMKRDEEEARGLLSGVVPLSALDQGVAF